MASNTRKWSAYDLDVVIARVKESADKLDVKDAVPFHLAAQTSQKAAGGGAQGRQAAVMERVVRITAALYLDRETGFLSERDGGKLVQEAYEILVVLAPNVSGPALGRMQQDLFRTAGQWLRAQGHHLSSSWYHEIALACLQQDKETPDVGLHMIRAQRMLRQAFASTALKELSVARTLSESDGGNAGWGSIALLTLHTERMSQRWDTAGELYQQCRHDQRVDERTVRDMDWEMLCIDACRSRRADGVVGAVQKGENHAGKAVYWLEAYFWSKVFPVANKKIKLASPQTRYRDNPKAMSTQGIFYKAAVALELADDSTGRSLLPHVEMGKIFALLPQLGSLDSEILVLLAYAKCSLDSGRKSMAELLLNHYRAKSLVLTGGQSNNVFNVDFASDCD